MKNFRVRAFRVRTSWRGFIGRLACPHLSTVWVEIFVLRPVLLLSEDTRGILLASCHAAVGIACEFGSAAALRIVARSRHVMREVLGRQLCGRTSSGQFAKPRQLDQGYLLKLPSRQHDYLRHCR
jgi:hypothetical protein